MADTIGTTILLVEDDILLSLDEKGSLEDYGYTVVTARSGEDSILAVSENPDIELVLMDINLGDGMDGTEAARRILEDRDIPILFLSSHAEKEVVEKTEKISSYGYVLKSAGITVVDSSIKMAFKLHHAYQDLRDREYLLNATQSLSKTGGWEYDLNTEELRWTKENYRIHGMLSEERPESSSDLIEKSLACYHPEDRKLVSEAFRGCCEKGEAYDLEVRFTDTKGHDKWIRTIGHAVWDNEAVVGVVGNIIDITERKEMENSLRESERTVRRKLDALLSPEGDIGTLNLADVIDTESTQSLMDDFYTLTGIGVAMVDRDGEVLVATGW
jgi:PAS domain S-box-containing protein